MSPLRTSWILCDLTSDLASVPPPDLASTRASSQDELEILRDLTSKVPQYEAKLDTYQKRLQEMGDLRRQIKLLEDKNTDYMQQNMELEEVRSGSGIGGAGGEGQRGDLSV